MAANSVTAVRVIVGQEQVPQAPTPPALPQGRPITAQDARARSQQIRDQLRAR